MNSKIIDSHIDIIMIDCLKLEFYTFYQINQ